jgi:hypothetical protein
LSRFIDESESLSHAMCNCCVAGSTVSLFLSRWSRLCSAERREAVRRRQMRMWTFLFWGWGALWATGLGRASTPAQCQPLARSRGTRAALPKDGSCVLAHSRRYRAANTGSNTTPLKASLSPRHATTTRPPAHMLACQHTPMTSLAPSTSKTSQLPAFQRLIEREQLGKESLGVFTLAKCLQGACGRRRGVGGVLCAS